MPLYLRAAEPCRDDHGRFAPCGGGGASGGSGSTPKPAPANPLGDEPPKFFQSFHDAPIKQA